MEQLPPANVTWKMTGCTEISKRQIWILVYTNIIHKIYEGLQGGSKGTQIQIQHPDGGNDRQKNEVQSLNANALSCHLPLNITLILSSLSLKTSINIKFSNVF